MMDRTVTHPEENIQQLIVGLLSKVINFLQILIPVIVRFSKEYPTAFIVISLIIGRYVVWRCIMSLYAMVRRLFYLSLVLLVVCAYMRGAELFFEHDVPLVANGIWDNRELIKSSVVSTCTYGYKILRQNSIILYYYLKNQLEEAIQK